MTEFEWIAGHLALDFVNTTAWPKGCESGDRFCGYEDLVAWAEEAGLAADAAALRREGRSQPDRAAAVLTEAVGLRRTLHEVFGAVTGDRPPPAAALNRLNRALKRYLPRLRLEGSAEGLRWGWREGASDLDSMLPPVVWSAARLLTSAERARVKACPDERCGWMFVDRSRRGNRRWCKMKECGSRHKARRYYRRQCEIQRPESTRPARSSGR